MGRSKGTAEPARGSPSELTRLRLGRPSALSGRALRADPHAQNRLNTAEAIWLIFISDVPADRKWSHDRSAANHSSRERCPADTREYLEPRPHTITRGFLTAWLRYWRDPTSSLQLISQSAELADPPACA